MNPLKKIAVILNIQSGEGQIILFLFVTSFVTGFVQTLTLTVSTTLFLDVYDSASLPYVYIGSAFLVPLLGALYSFWGGKIQANRKIQIAVLGLFLVMLLFWYAFSRQDCSKELFLCFYIWYFVQNLFLVNIGFWGTANRLLDVRQAKRLFGLIMLGEVSARVITGFSIEKLISILGGVIQLLIPAGLGILFLFVLLFFWDKAFYVQPVVQTQQKKDNSQSKWKWGSLRNSYILLVLCVSILSIASYYFVDINYLTQVKSHYATPSELASFIGLFSAISGLLTLLVGVLVSGPLVTHLGVIAGLVMLPLMTAAGVLLIMFNGNFAGWQGSIFYFSILTKLLYTTFSDTTAKVSSKILLKPLLPVERQSADVIKTIVMEPLFTGLVGFTLLKLPYHSDSYANILFAILICMLLVIFFLRSKYTGALKRAIGLRIMGGNSFMIEDSQSKLIIQSGLGSAYAGEVIYALDLLELSDVTEEKESEIIQRLIRHPAWEVRREVLLRIEHKELVSALDSVRLLLADEENPEVRGCAYRVLSVIGGYQDIEAVQESIQHTLPTEREEAVVGQLKSGEIEGILWGGEELLKLEKSRLSENRMQAARIIGKAGIDNFYRPLERLMRDENRLVRQEAIKACGNLNNPHLWQSLIVLLKDSDLKGEIAAALVKGGQSVIDIMEPALDMDEVEREERIILLQVCGKIGGKSAISILQKYLINNDIDIAIQAAQSLTKCRYRAAGNDLELTKNLIKNAVNYSTWLLAIRQDIEIEDTTHLLDRALKQRSQSLLVYIFSLLTFLYDPGLISHAWNILRLENEIDNRRVYALEILDEIISIEFKNILFPLIEAIPDRERLRRLKSHYPQRTLNAEQRMQEIFISTNTVLNAWIKAICLWTLEKKNPQVYAYHLKEIQQGQQQPLYMNMLEKGDGQMFSVVEKVIILKTVNIFSELPDEVLADIASGLDEVILLQGEKLFDKGDIGDSMYIIVKGEMLVHDGNREIARRGEREVIGEMALLDPQPRSASITALKESLLLRLEQEVFYDLIADRSEVARGIIRMLTRRLREAAGETR